MFEQKWQNTKPPKGVLLNKGHPLTKGLVGCWLMNEGGGNKVYDLSGNQNTGTFVGDTKWVPGKFGSCLSFDGTDDYVIIQNPGLSQTGTIAATLAIWVKTTNSHFQRVVTFYNSDGSTVFAVTMGHTATGNDANDGKPLGVYRNSANAWSIAKSTIAINDGKWHWLVFVVNGTSGNFYVDGVLKSSVSDVSFYTFNIVPTGHIGCYVWSFDIIEDFNGYLDYLGIYNRALSASEIAQLYREPFAMFNKARVWGVTGAPPTVDNAVFFGTNF